jgi:hypothetical protein
MRWNQARNRQKTGKLPSKRSVCWPNCSAAACGRTIFVADAHCSDVKRLVARAERTERNQQSEGCPKFYGRSHHAVTRVGATTGNVIERNKSSLGRQRL